MTDGGRLVARALKQQGVSHVFTLCGGHIMPIYEGCLDEGIRVVDVRHEQAAAMAADGWARVTGEPGVALVTAGPGVMNAVTGIANAQRSESPLVVIGGQGELTRFDQGSLQEGPQLPVVAPLTKWSRGVYEARRLEEYTHAAFRQARAPPTGPTYLEVPWDVLFSDADFDERYERGHAGATATRLGVAPDAALADAVELLKGAERPVILAGGTVRWSQSHDALARFASRAEIPVYLNGLGRGSLPWDHPFFFSLSRGAALSECDVLFTIGTPFDFRMGFGEQLAHDARIIVADADPSRLGNVRPADAALAGDPGATLDALAARLPAPPIARKTWYGKLQDLESRKQAAYAEPFAADTKPMHALRFLKELRDALPDDATLIGDGGNIVALAAKVMRVKRPGQWLDPGPFGTLGVGLPFALAAKLARPDEPVVVLEGDGSFGLNGFEFDTLVRYELPVVVVVGNDGAWQQIRAPQVAFYGEERAVATSLKWGTRYDLVAEALGGHGELVEDAKEVGHAVKRALASGKPAVVNCLIDPATNQGSGKPM